MNPMQDQVFDRLPKEWGIDRMKDVVSLRDKKTSDRSEEFDYIELEDIESGSGRLLKKRNTVDVESAVTLFEKGDVLFGKLRPYLEKFLQADFDGKCTGEILAFRPERIHSGFLRFCVASPWFIQLATVLSYGTKMPRANWPTQLATFDVPLPPPDEQERIAAYLEASCRTIDAAVSAKREQLGALNEFRKSFVSRAVSKGLNSEAKRRNSGVDWFGTIPVHWKLGHLKRFVTRIQTGLTPSSSAPEYFEDGTIPWYAPGSYGDELELHKPRKYASELAIHDGELRMFPSGTVFLIGIGATIGKVGLVVDPSSCNQQIIGIVAGDTLLPRYLAYQLKIYEAVIPGIAQATTLPIFDQVKTGYLPLLVPPLDEQHVICEFIDEKTKQTRSVVERVERQIDALVAYRKSLIHECVIGHRRITDEDVNRVTAHAASLA